MTVTMAGVRRFRCCRDREGRLGTGGSCWGRWRELGNRREVKSFTVYSYFLLRYVENFGLLGLREPILGLWTVGRGH